MGNPITSPDHVPKHSALKRSIRGSDSAWISLSKAATSPPPTPKCGLQRVLIQSVTPPIAMTCVQCNRREQQRHGDTQQVRNPRPQSHTAKPKQSAAEPPFLTPAPHSPKAPPPASPSPRHHPPSRSQRPTSSSSNSAPRAWYPTCASQRPSSPPPPRACRSSARASAPGQRRR